MKVPTTTWIHVFEQDTAEGAVFRPEDADIPLSRRPRDRFELHADGKAVLLVPGPQDGYLPQPASWTEEGDTVVVRDARGAIRLRIVHQSRDRLVVEMFRPERSH